MQHAAECFSVEGKSLSHLVPEPGLATGMSVLDDFLPWHGLPFGALTILEGPQSVRLARKLISRRQTLKQTVWIHSLRQRPFFHDDENIFRLQVAEDHEILNHLPEVLQESAFGTVVIQLSHPLSRPRAALLTELAENFDVALILVCKQPKIFPWEQAQLVIEANDDFFSIRKAQNRPVPLWIPEEMLDLKSSVAESPVLSWWNAIEPLPG